MREYKYTFYDVKGNVILTNTCVSETMFQYEYNHWFKNSVFHKAEIEIIKQSSFEQKMKVMEPHNSKR